MTLLFRNGDDIHRINVLGHPADLPILDRPKRCWVWWRWLGNGTGTGLYQTINCAPAQQTSPNFFIRFISSPTCLIN
jgi:hypothetical protein